jgi:hypothetical protein
MAQHHTKHKATLREVFHFKADDRLSLHSFVHSNIDRTFGSFLIHWNRFVFIGETTGGRKISLTHPFECRRITCETSGCDGILTSQCEKSRKKIAHYGPALEIFRVTEMQDRRKSADPGSQGPIRAFYEVRIAWSFSPISRLGNLHFSISLAAATTVI